MFHKTLSAGMGAMWLLAGFASAGGPSDLLITEVVDGPLTGGLPKWVELHNVSSTVLHMNQYSLGTYNNGGTTLYGGSSTVLAGTLLPGGTYVVSFENGDGPGASAFFGVYGVDPSDYDFGPTINGNDVIALFLADGSGPNGEATGTGSDATRIDVYGVIGVDGTGQVWDYANSYAFRCGSTPSPTFVPSDWNFGGAGALEAGCGGNDGCETLLLQQFTHPYEIQPCTVGDGYCFGDGSGAACPCGNAGGAGEGCANGTGSGAELYASGTLSVGIGDLVLHGANLVPNQPGLYFQGNNAPGGGNGVVFGDGLRCASAGVLRLEIRFANGTGHSNTTVNVAAAGAVSAGQLKRYQLWYRDPSSSPCGTSFNLSNGLQLVWLP